jgi:polyphosphate kinase 2
MGNKKDKNSKKKNADQKKSAAAPDKDLSRDEYEAELKKLHIELAHLQAHVKKHQLRIIVVFEGRDAAGKGGVIKALTERVSPRVFRTVALPAPSDREKTQWFIQRYIQHFPSGGEVVLFDRSWYNRAGVEPVMGFCTPEQHERFLRECPGFERDVVEAGIRIIKYFFDVSPEEQEKRFLSRMEDPMKHWKMSPMDVESYRRWWDYSSVYNRMIDATDTEACPWYRVDSDHKRRARLNCISHLLGQIPYEPMDWSPPELGERNDRKAGQPETVHFRHSVPPVY